MDLQCMTLFLEWLKIGLSIGLNERLIVKFANAAKTSQLCPGKLTVAVGQMDSGLLVWADT